MIRDITLGQYYPAESKIHKLDPRVKITACLVYIVALFIVSDFIGFAFSALALGLVIAFSKVPLRFMLRGLKPVFIIIIFTFLLNLFMTSGGEVLYSFWIFKISVKGLYTACFMAIRLILLIIGSSVLTLTTKPISLTDGIESLLKPLSLIGIPTHDLAMMMSIALRFIPTLLEETDKIMKAQQARGADFESGNMLRRAKALLPILVPLFISAFRIAADLAMAMEARCYSGSEKRTRMHQMKMSGRDYFSLGLLIMYLAIVIIWKIYTPFLTF